MSREDDEEGRRTSITKKGEKTGCGRIEKAVNIKNTQSVPASPVRKEDAPAQNKARGLPSARSRAPPSPSLSTSQKGRSPSLNGKVFLKSTVWRSIDIPVHRKALLRLVFKFTSVDSMLLEDL